MTFVPRQILSADALNQILTQLSQLQSAGAFHVGGSWDASSGSFPSGATIGATYIVTVAGTVSGVSFNVNDELIAIVNTPSTTVFSGSWVKTSGSLTRSQIETALGAALVGSAFVDTTNASNISTGSLAIARLAAIAAGTILGNNGGSSAVPSALTPSQVKALLAITLDDVASGSADFSMAGHKLTNVADPTNPQDAASKNYVDAALYLLDSKASCRVGTVANITLSGTQTIDGVAVVAGDRVLVKNQTTASQNGIYVVASGAWSRAPDMNSWAEVPGALLEVEDGTTNAGTAWLCISKQGGTLETTGISWIQATVTTAGVSSFNGRNGAVVPAANDYAVTQLAAIAASSLVGNNTGGSAAPTALTAAQVRTLLALATVATTGAYSDLSGKPTLGTAAALNVGTGPSNVVELDSSGKLPAVDGSQLTGVGAGWTQLASISIVGGSSAAISSIASYKELMIVITGLRESSTNTPAFNISSDNGSTTFAVGVWPTINSSSGNGSATYIILGNQARTKAILETVEQSPGSVSSQGIIGYSNANPVNWVQIVAGAGTLTQGTMTVYGRN